MRIANGQGLSTPLAYANSRSPGRARSSAAIAGISRRPADDSPAAWPPECRPVHRRRWTRSVWPERVPARNPWCGQPGEAGRQPRCDACDSEAGERRDQRLTLPDTVKPAAAWQRQAGEWQQVCQYHPFVMLVAILGFCSITGSATLAMVMSSEAMYMAKPAAITSHYRFRSLSVRPASLLERSAPSIMTTLPRLGS